MARQRAEAVSLAQGAPLTPQSLGPAGARQLQRLIGNQAVGRLLRQPRAPSNPGAQQTGLPEALKLGVEQLAGMDMSDVTVTYNSAKPAQIQALAYTQGADIHVGPGQEKHLAHEAWHVVQQKQGRVPATLQTQGVAINHDARLEHEAEAMGAKAAGLAVSEPQAQVPKKAQAIQAAQPPIQGLFVLTRTYTPNTDDVMAATTWGAATTLEAGKPYYVKGFDFQGNALLYDAQMGMDFLVKNDHDHLFTEVAVPPTPPQPAYVGFFDNVAASWKPQIFPRGCWLATMAVLSERTQENIQKSLRWSNDAFYGISAKGLVEFSQMINCKVREIGKDVEQIYASINAGKPVILGVPGHVLIIFAISTDKQTLRTWDPADGEIQVTPTSLVFKHTEAVFVSE